MYKSCDHFPHPVLEHPVHVPLVVLLPGLLLHRAPSTPGKGQVLEHALPVVAEHPVQPLSRVQGDQLIR